MPRPSPFHPRTQPLCRSFLWKEWNGYAAVRAFDAHREDEYHAVRHRAGIIDVSPLCSLEITGPDAGRLLSRVFSRDAERMSPHQVAYGVLLDAQGKVLDDGTCCRISEEHFRLSTSQRWVSWLARHGRGLRVSIEDSTDRVAVLAVQGPEAVRVLSDLVDFQLARMPFFRIRSTNIGGLDGCISRTGYTGDLGFELWVDSGDAVPLWDAVLEAGRDLGVVPFGLDALDVTRIEAGFVLQGVDYHSARDAVIESRKSTAHEAGLGWTLDLEREVPFIGQDCAEAELRRGSEWALVGVCLDSEELEGLYHEQGLPPHLSPTASRLAVPVYAEDGSTQVGQVTSHTWSPVLKRYIGLATVRRGWASRGTPLRVEHTVEYERRTVRARVVERPFFDPPRKRQRLGQEDR